MSAEPEVAIKAFFYTLDEAERAKVALELSNRVDGPSGQVPPVNGRQWRLEITPGSTGSLSPKYPSAAILDRIFGTVLKFNGTTAVPFSAPMASAEVRDMLEK